MSRYLLTIIESKSVGVNHIATGLAIQLHHAARLLLCVNEPFLGGVDTYLKHQRTIQECIRVVCGVAMALNDDASSVISSQSLYIGKHLWLPTSHATHSRGDRCYGLTSYLSRDVYSRPRATKIHPRVTRILSTKNGMANRFTGRRTTAYLV